MTLPELLRWRVAQTPNDCFIRMRSRELTFAEFDTESDRVAAALQVLGVGEGEVVAIMAANSPEHLLTWFATLKLRAVHAAVNTEFRGPGLASMLALSGCRLLLVGREHLEHVADVLHQLPAVQTVLVIGDADDTAPLPGDRRVVCFDELVAAAPKWEPTAVAARDTDTAMLLFTSGTTGQSKACELSHRYAIHQARGAIDNFGFRTDDVLYCCYPLFHLDAPVFTVVPALLLGCPAAIGVRFSASGFWDEVRAFGATVIDYLGATLTMLHNRPPRSDDDDNPVRLGWGIPRPEWAPEFEERFGLRLVDGYGLTEAGVAVVRPSDRPVPTGSCGLVVEPYALRVVDEDDDEVPPGEVGEIVLRSSVPFTMMSGYYRMPEATLAISRNLWLHTGDLARRDADGFLYFVGRSKEAIRRRGENISVHEIEEVVLAHPAVAEAAAVGVPSELTEEDVKVCVVLRPDTILVPSELVEFCRPRLARYMLPRYVEVLDELPRTPTEKVARHQLRGVTERTWDGQVAAPVQAGRA